MKNHVWRAVLSVMLIAAMLCTGLTVPVKAAASISDKNVSLVVGEQKKLSVKGASGTVTWSSNKKSVADVSKSGVVTAKKAGSAVITAKVGKKSYTCKVTVKKLPKDYATVNGVKVKVGKKVVITYKIQSKTPVLGITLNYFYDRKGLKITNTEEQRMKLWFANEAFYEYHDTETDETYDLFHLIGIDKNDPYKTSAVDCKTAKVFDQPEIKVLKSGNYTYKGRFRYIYDKDYKDIKNYKITESIKVK